MWIGRVGEVWQDGIEILCYGSPAQAPAPVIKREDISLKNMPPNDSFQGNERPVPFVGLTVTGHTVFMRDGSRLTIALLRAKHASYITCLLFTSHLMAAKSGSSPNGSPIAKKVFSKKKLGAYCPVDFDTKGERRSTQAIQRGLLLVSRMLAIKDFLGPYDARGSRKDPDLMLRPDHQ